MYFTANLRELLYITISTVCILLTTHNGTLCSVHKKHFKKTRFVLGQSDRSGVVKTVSTVHCLSKCEDTCLFVRSDAEGTCIMFADAVLLADSGELNNSSGISGYRKVNLTLLNNMVK